MSFRKIYKFEKLISKTNNIRDCIQIAVAYYVYFDLPKIKNLSRVDKKNYIIDILTILCIALKEKIELNNIKQSINKNNLKLIEYLNIIVNLKKELHSEYYISSTINPVLYNLMSKRYRTVFKSTIKMIYTCQCSNKTKQMNITAD